jgi:hypothetical protein
MAWPKGVPRGKKNINPESAVNPFRQMETMSHVAQPPQETSGQADQPASPHLLENKTEFRPFNDSTTVMDDYMRHMGIDPDKEVAGPGNELQPPTQEPQDTAVKTEAQPDTQTTIEVKKDEPVIAQEPQEPSTPIKQPTTVIAEPSTPSEKYKSKEEAERGAREAERKMHEATQELARTRAEKAQLESFNKQMIDVMNALKSGQPVVPKETKPEVPQYTPEQMTELMVNDPDKFASIIEERAEQKILRRMEERQKADNARIQQESRQRAETLFLKMGDQHLQTKYPEMKDYGPFIQVEFLKVLQSPEGQELVGQRGPQGIVDKAVENTKILIEQIVARKNAESKPQESVANAGGEVRTPIPAAPVVTPHGVLPAPPKPAAPVAPTAQQRAEDYVAERNAWRAQRGLS